MFDQGRLAAFFKDRIFLWLLLAAFVLLKLPHLDVPFYWDECWPYATAVRRMYEHGPSLLPGTIGAEYYRGHPTLFYFLASGWMKLFGTSHVAMHSFPLFVSVLLLISVYEAGLRWYGPAAAMTASLLVAFQVAFFIQASFLLPEVLLAFFAFLGLCFYAARKYLLTALALSCLFYTKESGMVLGALLGLHAFLMLFQKQEPLRHRLLPLLSIAVPFLLTALFFLAQKRIMGWYLFPLHTGLIEHSLRNFVMKLGGCFSFLYLESFRHCMYGLWALALVLEAFAGGKRKQALPHLAALVLLAAFPFITGLHKVRLLLPPLLLIWILRTVHRFLRQYYPASRTAQHRLLLLCPAFVLAFCCFTAMNIFILRYLLIALVPSLFVLGIMLARKASRLKSIGMAALLLLIVLAEALVFYRDEAYGDINPGAFDGMYVQQQLTRYLERMRYYDKKIGTNSYLERMHLTDPYTGFLSSGKTFSQVNWEITPQTELAVFSNIEPDYQYEMVKKNPAFRRVFRVDKGKVWGEVYLRQ